MLTAGALMTGLGMALAMMPEAAFAADGGEPGAGAVGQIYRLQAAFHRAKSTQDIDLMMSLWDPHGTLHLVGDPNSPYAGLEQLKAFLARLGLVHAPPRFSLVPSFKTQIDVHGDAAYLYFECHDVGDYDLPARQIVADTFLAGTLHRGRQGWVFFDMTAGKAFPLSVDHYYYPSSRHQAGTST